MERCTVFTDRRLNIKMSVLPNWSVIKCNSNQNPNRPFCRNWRVVSKIYMKYKGPRITKILKKKNEVGGFILLHFKTLYKATVIKTLWLVQQNRV